jgi:hypothetical protein
VTRGEFVAGEQNAFCHSQVGARIQKCVDADLPAGQVFCIDLREADRCGEAGGMQPVNETSRFLSGSWLRKCG